MFEQPRSHRACNARSQKLSSAVSAIFQDGHRDAAKCFGGHRPGAGLGGTVAALSGRAKTVANYHYEIKSKLGVRSNIELVYLCMRQGLVAPRAAPGPA